MAGNEASFIVRLIDKITRPARQATKAMRALQSGMTAFAKGTGKGRDEMGRFTAGSRGFTAQMSGMKMALSQAAGIGIAALVQGMAQLGAAMVTTTLQTADFTQRMNLGFASVAKHGASAAKLFGHVRKLSEELGLDVQDTSSAFLKFLALQFDPKMATDLIKMGADLRGLGSDAEGINRVFAQLGQIQAKGKLQGEELIVLAENGISTQLVYEQLGKTLGKTRDEVLKMQQAGKLTSDVALPAILAAVRQKTGGATGELGAQIANQTLGGMAGRLKAQFQNRMIDVVEAATPAITSALLPIGMEISKVLGSDAFKTQFVAGILAVSRFIQDALPFVKAFVSSFADGFGAALPALKEALGLLFSGFGSDSTWLETTKEFANTLGKVAAFAGAVAVVIGGSLAAAIQMATWLVKGLIAGWDGFINAIGASVFAVTDFAHNFVAGLVRGITDGAGKIFEAAAGIGRTLLKGLDSVLKFGSPSKTTTGLGMDAAQGMINGQEKMLSGIHAAGAAMGGASVSAMGSSAMALPTSSGQVLSFSAPITIQVTQAPGESSAALADRLADDLEDRMSSVFERLVLEVA